MLANRQTACLMHANSTTSPVTALAGHMNNSVVYMLLSLPHYSLPPSNWNAFTGISVQSIQTFVLTTALVTESALLLHTNMQYWHKVAMHKHSMQGNVWHFAATTQKFGITTFFPPSYCFLMFFVCSWHLSQKELRLSTPLIPLLGERVSVK